MTLAEVQLMGNLWKMPWDADHLLMFDDANRLRRLGACKGFLDGKFHKDATACLNYCKYLSLAQIYFPCIDAARPFLFLSTFSRWSLTVAHWSLKMASRTMLRMLHSCVKLCKNLQIAGNSGLRLAKLMRRGCHNFVAMFSVQAICLREIREAFWSTNRRHSWKQAGFSMAFSGIVLQERLRNRRTQALVLSVREMSSCDHKTPIMIIRWLISRGFDSANIQKVFS